MPVRRLYMDNAATSFPKPKGVLEAMTRYATDCGASAGRGGYAEAAESGKLLSDVRQRLCTLFNGDDPRQFIFTANCTDAPLQKSNPAAILKAFSALFQGK